MAKLPFMQFYPADYQADVRCLSMAVRGAWMEILCVLWRAPKRGQRTLTMDEWAREVGCSAVELGTYLDELTRHRIGKITREFHENVEQITIASKRIMREKMKQMLALKRKRKQRDVSMSRDGHAPVTDVSQPCHAEESEIRSQKSKSEEEEKNKRKRARSRRLTDEEFLDALRVNRAYSHLNIDIELAKMDAWLQTRPGKEKTRRFIVNWLNRAEKPMSPHRSSIPRSMVDIL